MNIQQFNKDSTRRIIIAPDNHWFVKSDLSQAEVRVVAWVANIRSLIERFTNDPDFDIHRWNASNIFERSEGSITKSERSIAKAGVHGGNYGLREKKAATIYGLSIADAKRSLETYRRELPEVAQWWLDIQETIHATRTLFSPLGRRRTFYARLDDALYRSAYSFIPQATVVDIINRALYLSDLALARCSAYPILQIHDELCFIVPKGALGSALEKIKNLMEYPVKVKGIPEPMTIPCDLSYGPNWWDQEEVTL
jgi:DNA polymerase-1